MSANKSKLTITGDQLEEIEHYQRMFRLNSERIEELCEGEQDDIVYGFKLGQMHSHLENCFMEMMKLTDSIRSENN